jgi:hypothetical protein
MQLGTYNHYTISTVRTVLTVRTAINQYVISHTLPPSAICHHHHHHLLSVSATHSTTLFTLTPSNRLQYTLHYTVPQPTLHINQTNLVYNQPGNFIYNH